MKIPLYTVLAAGLAGVIIAEETNRITAGRTVTQEAQSVVDTVDTFIKKMEGFSATAYADGQGQSEGFGHFITGTETTRDPNVLFAQDLAIATDAVNGSVVVPLTGNQRAALTSFAYNVGVGAFKKSTLLRLLNEGDYTGAADQFARWNKTTGQDGVKRVSEDLIKRRAAEKELFQS